MNVAPPEFNQRILPAQRHTTNFIEAYMDYAKHQEAPRSFHLWTAISILAGALGRHVLLDRGVYKIYPNLYVLIVGLSGVMKKSTSTGAGVELLEAVPGIKMLANQVTQASMIQSLANSNTKFDFPGLDKPMTQCSLYIYASEFKNFTNEVFGSLVESLTDLYDCKPHFTRETKKDGITKVFGPCLNMLACSTSAWLREAIPPSQLSGGFASRILFVVENDPGKAVPIPYIDPHLEEKKQKLIDDLCLINKYVGKMQMDEEATETFSTWYVANRDKVIKGGVAPMFAGYIGRRGTMVEKLSMILVANEGPGLVIQKRHVEQAIELIEGLAQGMYDAFETVGGNILGNKILRVYEVIRQSPGIHPNELWRRVVMEMGMDELRTATAELLACGAIGEQREGGLGYVPIYPELSLGQIQAIPVRLRKEQLRVVLEERQQPSSAPQAPSSPIPSN